MKLTQEQVNFFRRSGYIKLLETIPEDLLEQLRSSLSDLFDKPDGPTYTDAAGKMVKIADLYGRGAPFTELITSPLLLDPLESLLGPNIVFTRYRHNHAARNSPHDPAVRLHRDILQWSRSIISVVVYLEDSTADNGCTYVIPSSHYLPFVGTPNNGGTWMDEHSVYKDLITQAVPVPMEAGGILMFDGLLFHTVGQNRSNKTRESIALGYHSIDELDENNLPESKVLVRGGKLYRGNDLKFKSPDLSNHPIKAGDIQFIP